MLSEFVICAFFTYHLFYFPFVTFATASKTFVADDVATVFATQHTTFTEFTVVAIMTKRHAVVAKTRVSARITIFFTELVVTLSASFFFANFTFFIAIKAIFANFGFVTIVTRRI